MINCNPLPPFTAIMHVTCCGACSGEENSPEELLCRLPKTEAIDSRVKRYTLDTLRLLCDRRQIRILVGHLLTRFGHCVPFPTKLALTKIRTEIHPATYKSTELVGPMSGCDNDPCSLYCTTRRIFGHTFFFVDIYI